MQDEKSKPFPMPGTVWIWHGDDQAPPSGPHMVVGLRWQSGEVQAIFTEDDRYPGYSCASVGHMMRLAAWVCEAPTMPDAKDADLAERIKAFRDIAALLRTRAQAREGQAHDALMSVSVDIEKHADGMAADEKARDLFADEREKRARDLYERWLARTLPGAKMRWGEMSTGMRERWLTIVDIIGEIERERHPQRVVTAGDLITLTEFMGPDAAPSGMSPERLAEIAARCAPATPGPWRRDGGGDIYGSAWGRLLFESDGSASFESANSDFVAHAREDVPALLAEVERLRAIERRVRYRPGQEVRITRQPLTEAEARAWAEEEVRLYCAPDASPHRPRLVNRIASVVLRANRGEIPPEVRPSDPLALDPEDGSLCGGCRAPRNAIHSPLCPTRAGAKVDRIAAEHPGIAHVKRGSFMRRDHMNHTEPAEMAVHDPAAPDDATRLVYGTYSEAAKHGTTMLNGAEPGRCTDCGNLMRDHAIAGQYDLCPRPKAEPWTAAGTEREA